MGDIGAKREREIETQADIDARSTELLAAIVKSSQDAIIGKSLAGEIVSWNPGAERLYGWSAREAIGESVSLLVPENQRALESDLFARIIAGDPLEAYEVQRRHKNGHVLDVELSMSPIFDASGATIGVASSSRDIGHRKAAEASIRVAQLEAEHANAAKNEFLSRMSHELRTPLNAVLGFAQILELDFLSPSQLDAVGHILQGGNHLLELINDVLDITGIEADKLELSIEPVNVNELVAETVALMRPLASTSQVSLRSPITRGDAYVRADRRRLRQVIMNLISNAIKYNRPAGRVDVNAQLTPDDEIAITVSDTGMGIRSEDLPRLFNPFDRLGEQSAGIEGTGIGLALSERLVALLGGQLRVESRYGEGSTFTVTMPRTETPNSAAVVIHPDGQSTLLYIEDNPLNVHLMDKVVARRATWQMFHAASATLGLELARSIDPTVIVLDLHLPDMEGIDVLIRLRADPVTSAIPIAVLSADASRGQIERLLTAGAELYITKPLKLAEVLTFMDVHAVE